MKIRR
jgi:hypothetical protein